MHDYTITVDGEDTRTGDDRNKSGRGRLAGGSVTAVDMVSALRETAGALETVLASMPDEMRGKIVRVQLKRAD